MGHGRPPHCTAFPGKFLTHPRAPPVRRSSKGTSCALWLARCRFSPQISKAPSAFRGFFTQMSTGRGGDSQPTCPKCNAIEPRSSRDREGTDRAVALGVATGRPARSTQRRMSGPSRCWSRLTSVVSPLAPPQPEGTWRPQHTRRLSIRLSSRQGRRPLPARERLEEPPAPRRRPARRKFEWLTFCSSPSSIRFRCHPR